MEGSALHSLADPLAAWVKESCQPEEKISLTVENVRKILSQDLGLMAGAVTQGLELLEEDAVFDTKKHKV